MNENIDLTKILDGCPNGVKFYSPLFGDVEFICIIYNGASEAIGIKLRWSHKSGRTCDALLKSNGMYFESCGGEIMLFPSKEQRDWSKFERFWDKPKVERFDPKTLQPFDRVLVRDYNVDEWDCNLFSHHDGGKTYPYVCVSSRWTHCIPFNEETKHLAGTTDDCPEYYKWWEEQL